MRRRSVPAPLIDLGLVAIALLDVWIQPGYEGRIALFGALAACAVLMLRRRVPLLVFVATLPAVLVTWAVYANLIALYSLATRNRNRRLLAGCVLASAVCTVVPWPVPKLESLSLDGTSLLLLLYGLATAAAPVFLGQLILARRDLAARLEEITEARAHEELLTMQGVLATERAQLAREMHDVVSHQVSLISVRAGALQVSTTDPDTKQAAATIGNLYSFRDEKILSHHVIPISARNCSKTDWGTGSRPASGLS